MVSHSSLSDLDQEDHPKYGPLAAANIWSGLNQFTSKLVASSLGLNGALPPAGFWLSAQQLNPPPGTVGLAAVLGFSSFSAGTNTVGVAGYCVKKHAGTTSTYGLDFVSGAHNFSLAASYGARVTGLAIGAGVTVTASYGFYVNPNAVIVGTIATSYGLFLPTLGPATARRPIYEAIAPVAASHSILGSTLQLFSAAPSFGNGVGVLGIANAVTVPTANPAGGGILYAQAGALKWRGSGGTITNIAAA